LRPAIYLETNWRAQASNLLKKAGGTMKLVYVGVLVGVVLAGFSADAQMRGGFAGGTMVGSGNGGVIEHTLPATSPVSPSPRAIAPVQANMGDHQGAGHLAAVGERGMGGRREFGPRGDFGGRHIDLHGRHFDHHFFHERGVVIFAYGVPYYYYPDYGYYDLGPYSAADSSTGYTPASDTQTEQYANPDADSFYQPGYQWGGELKLYHVTMDQFVAYLKSYILGASPVQQAAFRSGFVAHFGAEGQAIYDQAAQQAIPQN
jgi:hypothetical protein